MAEQAKGYEETIEGLKADLKQRIGDLDSQKKDHTQEMSTLEESYK